MSFQSDNNIREVFGAMAITDRSFLRWWYSDLCAADLITNSERLTLLIQTGLLY